MSLSGLRVLMVFLFVLTGVLYADAQFPDAGSPDGRSGASKEDYPDGIKETFAKQRIKAEEKKFDELLEQSEEAAALSSELQESFAANRKLMPEDVKKVERLEKLVKKIRDKLGSESDDDKDKSANDAPLNFNDALKNLQETSNALCAELKKQGRFGISVAAVENSNTLLKLVRLVRQNQN